jgi:glycosyltransferase involved in cell wall biosynthesis
MAGREDPLVSVLMASYEAAGYIGEALESALGQTYPNLEVLVADDCSSDGTAEVAEEYASRHPGRVRVLRGERNLGSWRNRDRALQASRGELLTQLDADDVWMPEKLERQVEVMRSRPEVGLVYTGFERFDSADGGRIGPPVPARIEGRVFERFWTDGNFVNSVTAMWRREAMARRGVTHLWSHGEPHVGDDYNLWLLISLDWEVAAISETLARYRRHESNLTTTGGANPHLIYLNLLRGFVRDYPECKPRIRGARRRRLALERRFAGAFEVRGGRRARGAAMWLRGFAGDPAPVLRPQLSALTMARIATRPIQPSYWRERRRRRVAQGR